MTRPRMLVVAGPPGSGKSLHFPVASFGADGFNVDLRAAAANRGSFAGIPRSVRRSVQRECERFIEDHIARRVGFAVETTLRTAIAMSQAESAQRAGFDTAMLFVCAGSVEECVRRVRLRGLAGGPPEVSEQHVPSSRSIDADLAGLHEYDVVGPICESTDKLASGRKLPPHARQAGAGLA